MKHPALIEIDGKRCLGDLVQKRREQLGRGKAVQPPCSN